MQISASDKSRRNRRENPKTEDDRSESNFWTLFLPRVREIDLVAALAHAPLRRKNGFVKEKIPCIERKREGESLSYA